MEEAELRRKGRRGGGDGQAHVLDEDTGATASTASLFPSPARTAGGPTGQLSPGLLGRRNDERELLKAKRQARGLTKARPVLANGATEPTPAQRLPGMASSCPPPPVDVQRRGPGDDPSERDNLHKLVYNLLELATSRPDRGQQDGFQPDESFSLWRGPSGPRPGLKGLDSLPGGPRRIGAGAWWAIQSALRRC
jgi:hypothetical protein